MAEHEGTKGATKATRQMELFHMRIDQSTIMVLLFVAAHAVHPRWPRRGGGGGRVRLSGQQSASAGSVNRSRRCQKGQRAQTCQEAAEPLSAVRDRKLEEELWEQLQPGSRKAAESRSSPRCQHPQHGKSTCSFKTDYCLTPNNNNNHSVLHSGSGAIVCVVMGTAAYSFDM